MRALSRLNRAVYALVAMVLCAGLMVCAQPAILQAPAEAAPATATGRATPVISPLGLALEKELLSSELATRREAALRCADLGPDAIACAGLLARLLGDHDLQVQGNAAYALLRMRRETPRALATLIDHLGAESTRTSCRAAFMLGDVGELSDSAVEPLRQLLAGNDAVRQLHAAEALLKINPLEWNASRYLFAALQSDAREVRFFAACVLGLVATAPDDALKAQLFLSLVDPDPQVASAATVTLLLWDARAKSMAHHPYRRAGLDQSAPATQAALIELLESRDLAEKRSAAAALAAFGKIDAAAPVVRRRLADPDPLVRGCAACMLWRLEGRARALTPALRTLVETGELVNVLPAACALGQIGPQAVDALLALREQCRHGGIEGLAVAAAMLRIDLSDAEARETVLGALVDPSSDMRAMAARLVPLLPVSSDSELLAGLALGLRDDKLRVRVAARQALEQLETSGLRDTIEEALRLVDEGGLPEVSAQPAASSTGSANGVGNPVGLAPPMTDPPELPAAEGTLRKPVALEPRIVALSENDLAAGEPSGVVLALPSTEPAEEARPAPKERPAAHPHPGSQPKPVRELSATIKPPEGELPEDIFAKEAQATPLVFHNLGAQRGWRENLYCWDAPAVCFAPLYFEEINSERFGWRVPYLQSFFSGATFGLNCLLLPVRLAAEPPCDCLYTLGYDRPGSCVPLRCHCPKLVPTLCRVECDEEPCAEE